MGNEGADRRLAHQDSPDSLQALMLLESPCPASRHHLPTALPIAGLGRHGIIWRCLSRLRLSIPVIPTVLGSPETSFTVIGAEREENPSTLRTTVWEGMTPIHIGIAGDCPSFCPSPSKCYLRHTLTINRKGAKPLQKLELPAII